MIQLNEVTVQFGSLKALNQITLSLSDTPALVGLIGPNGAGKTTLIKTIFGQEKIKSGQYFCSHHDMTYCPDMPIFEPYLNASEVLQQSLALYGKPIDPNHIKEMLAFVGLDQVKKRYVSHFSRGMTQRLGIASVLILQPKLLFLDEPTSALDPIGREEILHLIQHIAKERKVVVSSHLLNDMQRIADQLLILHHGKLRYDGDLIQFINQIDCFSTIKCYRNTDKNRIQNLLCAHNIAVEEDKVEDKILHFPKKNFEEVFHLVSNDSDKIQTLSQDSVDLTDSFIRYLSKYEKEGSHDSNSN